MLIDRLKRLVPPVQIDYHEGRPVGISLHDENSTWGGMIRHYSDQDKLTVLKLISQIDGLKNLNLRKNKIGPLPDCLQALTSLESLNLGSNYIGTIPEWIRGLRQLTYLNLGVNELRELPAFLVETKLEILKVHKNHLQYLPEEMKVLKLRSLNLYSNAFKSIPEFIYEYDLEMFFWGISGIKELSPKIAAWKNMLWFNVIGNKLEQLPEEICLLTKMRSALLHKNRLRELPKRFGDLVNLEEISLYDNQLEKLPESFFKLKLKKANLSGNRLHNTPHLEGVEWLNV